MQRYYAFSLLSDMCLFFKYQAVFLSLHVFLCVLVWLIEHFHT